MNRNRLKRQLKKMIESLPGFKCLDIEIRKSGHCCCTVRDDAGNEFRAFTGTTCSSYEKAARLNFRQDCRKLSNIAKGLIES